MFHFPGFAPSAVYIPAAVTGHCSRRVSPFRHLRIIGCLAPPRSFSQLTASFFAFRRQGIRLVRFITCLKKTSLLALFNCQFRSSRCPDPLRFETVTASLRSDPLGGGDGRNRTDDPLRAKQVLSQLSYAPDTLVGLERLELSTSRLSGVRSNHLSYRPASAAPCK